MQKNSRSLTHLTNEQLIDQVKTLAARERDATAHLIASNGQVHREVVETIAEFRAERAKKLTS